MVTALGVGDTSSRGLYGAHGGQPALREPASWARPTARAGRCDNAGAAAALLSRGGLRRGGAAVPTLDSSSLAIWNVSTELFIGAAHDTPHAYFNKWGITSSDVSVAPAWAVGAPGTMKMNYDHGDVDILVGKSNNRLRGSQRHAVLRPALYENRLSPELTALYVGTGPEEGGAARDALGARVIMWAGGVRQLREVVGAKGHRPERRPRGRVWPGTRTDRRRVRCAGPTAALLASNVTRGDF